MKRSVEQRDRVHGRCRQRCPGRPPRDIAFESPASYPEVLTVTAASDTDGAPGGSGPASMRRRGIDDSYATFSNFATRPMDIAHVVAAPGVCIESTGAGRGRDDRLGHERLCSARRGRRRALHRRGRRPGAVRRDDAGGGDRADSSRRGGERHAAERLPRRSVLPASGGPILRTSRVRARPDGPPDPTAAGLRSWRPRRPPWPTRRSRSSRCGSRAGSDVDDLSVVVRLAEAGHGDRTRPRARCVAAPPA